MSEINPGTIERDTAVDDKESNGKVEDQPKEDLIILSERVSKLEQNQRDTYTITAEAYKNKEEQKINLRAKYAKGANILVWTWSIFLMASLVFDAIETLKFQLSDKIIISLIAGVTINILAVYMVVMKNLFPKTIENINKNE